MKTPLHRLLPLLSLLALAPAPARALEPQAPAQLPGDGLKHRDFLFTGQLDDTLFMVRDGRIVWSDRVPGAYGHVQDATVLSSGNLLLAYMTGVKVITPSKKVLWNYSAPKGSEIHTARAIGTAKVLFVQDGTQADVFLANLETNAVEHLFSIPVGDPSKVHYQTRRSALTDAGTLLLARTDLGKVSEFDLSGREVWSAAVPRPWSVQRLANGNTLVCSFEMFVRELDPRGQTVWEFTPKDAPGYAMPKWCVATRLANGNTLIANNTAVPADAEESRAPVQAFELKPDKTIAWALRSWKEPNLGPGWIIQYLDEPGVPEDRHFGSIR